MGRSTGCCDENGLLPTRGVRGAGFGAPDAGPGRGPGVGAPGRGALGGAGAGAGACAAGAGAGACAAGAGAAGGGCGAGAAGFGAAGFGAALAGVGPGLADGRGAPGAGAAVPLEPPDGARFSCDLAGFPPPNASRNRRATGASTVDEADLTNSPCSLSRASTSLLLTPSSFANSCTRALPATTTPLQEAQRWWGRASGSAMTHGHRDFTVCSCSSLPVLLPGGRATLRPEGRRTTRPPRWCPADR